MGGENLRFHVGLLANHEDCEQQKQKLIEETSFRGMEEGYVPHSESLHKGGKEERKCFSSDTGSVGTKAH